MCNGWPLAAVALAIVSGEAFGSAEISRSVIACGGLGGTSATYEVRSTLGQPIVGSATSAHYTINAGFWLGFQALSSAEGGLPDLDNPSGGHLPKQFQLYASVPNPTGLGSRIAFDVPAVGGRVVIRLYNPAGALVRNLVDQPLPPGRHMAVWDGRNDKGRVVASGVYFLAMEAPAYKARERLTVIR